MFCAERTLASPACGGYVALCPSDRRGYGTRMTPESLRRTARGMLAALLLSAAATEALAWGATGHRIIGETAVNALPPELPAFVRSADAAVAIGQLSREPDRSRGAGRIHDHQRDAAHFVDLDDAGLIMGGPPLAVLPPTRLDYQKALLAAGSDEVKAGYLPYAIVDGWQQLVKDFVHWRVLHAAEARAVDPGRRAWLAEDRRRREALIVNNLGLWAHYVGDASQPHHLSIHYNGWGAFPNPRGYTQEKVHGPFEGAFTKATVTGAAVAAALPAYVPCSGGIEACTVAYLQQTYAQVIPYFELEKAGGFKPGDPRGAAFARERVTASTAKLRDLTVDAWRASAGGAIGYRPEVTVADVEAGRVDPWDALYGTD